MRFKGTTDEGEVIEFTALGKDSDLYKEYGSEIGVHQGIWNYVKKDTLVCLEVEELERQLAEARELTDKFIKRTESVLQALYEDGSEEGHSEFFYRMNTKEQCLHEGFLRKLKKLKEKG